MSGERFRVARARSRLTLADVARACECSAQAVKKWEDDEAMPNSQRLATFCQITDVSLEWIMSADALDFRSTAEAPQGRHAKYWVRAALAELALDAAVAPNPQTQGGE